MESKDKSKEIDIKTCVCYYFDDMIKNVNIFFSDFFFLDERLYENISVYDISYKT